MSAIEDCLVPFCKGPHQFLLDRARTHGPVALYRLNDEVFASVSDPAIAHFVLQSGMDDFEKGPILDVVRAIFGYGIFSADRDDWTMQAKAIAPMFARHRLRQLGDMIHAHTDRQLDRWRSTGDAGDATVMIALKRLAFDVVAISLLSLHDEGHRAALFDALYHLDRLPMVSVGYLGKLLPLQQLAGVVSSAPGTSTARLAETNAIVYAIVDQRLAATEQADDVIGALLASPAISALPLERRRLLLRDEIVSMLTAGYASTGESMFWALYHLARHPDVQGRARAEVLTVDGPLTEPPPYLAAVINESLRLYPAAWYMGRTTRKPMQLGGVEIPVGTQVLCSPFILHRQPELWPDPHTFSPERFLPGATIIPRSFMPFGTGARGCVGRALAMMEITSLLSGVLTAFELEMAEAPPTVTLKGTFSLQPRERISLRFRTRS
ncbi:MAG: cytochrome P450 [Gemmatimonadota bacterium]